MNSLLTGVIFVPLVSMLLLQAVQSLHWGMQHDFHGLIYMSYVINHFHYVPYRDFFDIIMPGALPFYSLVGVALGYEDVYFRIADLICLIATLGVTVGFMGVFGWRVALLGTMAFGSIYMSTQAYNFGFVRENLILLPLSIAVLLTFATKSESLFWRTFAVGVLLGLCTTIKPCLAIGAPLLVFFLWYEAGLSQGIKSAGPAEFFKLTGIAVAGFVVTLGAMFLTLWWLGALSPFVDVATNYWPIYAKFSGEEPVLTAMSKAKFIVKEYFRFGGHALLLAPAVLGAFVSLFLSDLPSFQKRRIVLLGALAITYTLCPVLGGKLWSYQWMFFLYFLVLLCAFCIVPQAHARPRAQQLFPALVLLVSLIPSIAPGIHRTLAYGITGRHVPIADDRNAAEIAGHLKTLLQPGDAVQPWGNANVDSRAMLIAGAKPATSFLFVNWLTYDIGQWPDIPDDRVRRLRDQFLRELQHAKPRLFLEMDGTLLGKPGAVLHPELRPIRDLIDSQFDVKVQGQGYRILERKQ